MEPVDGARDPAELLAEQVAALHVRQLMQEDDLPAFVGPLRTKGGNDDRAPPDAAREGHLDLVALQERGRFRQVEPVRQVVKQSRPPRLVERARRVDDAPGRAARDDQPADQREGDAGPEGEQRLRPRGPGEDRG